MRKMRQFQELGHQAVIIIGNYTALVGDPSGRDETRARLTAEQIDENAKDYLNQVGKVLDLSKAEVVHNGDWFAKMSFADILELTSKVTVAQLLTRDDFSKRYREERPIYLHEMLYPVMQAWDSVEVKSDVELGGTEQLYSFMLARDLQRDQKIGQQTSVMSPILVGLDGVRRMGKSLGNYIGISESPFDMMKKFMQLPDDCMQMYFELLTDLPLEEVNSILAGHPKEAKTRLAETIISEYHPPIVQSIDHTLNISQQVTAEVDQEATPRIDQAKAAVDRWQREIGQGNLPTDIAEEWLHTGQLDENGRMQADRLLKELGLVPSTSEAMRRIKGGAAWYMHNDKKIKIEDRRDMIPVHAGMIVRAGKKDIRKVQVRFVDKE